MVEFTPDWITAIGTVLAVIVAIVLSVSSKISNWWNRPKFKVEFENKVPYCRTTMAGRDEAGHPVLEYWIRLRVFNSGRSVAKYCEGKLVKIIDAQTKKERDDFDPVVLPWVGATNDRPIDINKKEDEFLDIIHTRSHNQDTYLIKAVGFETDQKGINRTPPRRDYLLHIEIYGANLEPKFVEMELKNATKFDEIRAFIKEKSSIKK